MNSFAKVPQIRLGNWQRIALSQRADLHHLLYCNKLSISKLQLLHGSFAACGDHRSVWKEIRTHIMKITSPQWKWQLAISGLISDGLIPPAASVVSNKQW